MSFNSPEFQKLLPQMDEKMRPINTARMEDEMCLRTSNDELLSSLMNAMAMGSGGFGFLGHTWVPLNGMCTNVFLV